MQGTKNDNRYKKPWKKIIYFINNRIKLSLIFKSINLNNYPKLIKNYFLKNLFPIIVKVKINNVHKKLRPIEFNKV